MRKVFTVAGVPVHRLSQFFEEDDVFFAYGNERVGANDFELEAEESKAIQAHRKTLRSSTTRTGPKPKMPVKSHNDTFVCVDESLLNGGIHPDSLPLELQAKYTLGSVIGGFHCFLVCDEELMLMMWVPLLSSFSIQEMETLL